jgi:hypothetical protein
LLFALHNIVRGGVIIVSIALDLVTQIEYNRVIAGQEVRD